ncbi:hypothetical protein N7463_010925 [Penicillium fimorum]|uniref:Carboxylesterase type B domain-containing protein n=1 Tax=Penicillium fimorum TaxID=1882269 RepID=A0A9W9XKV7_9EURO|nr:hypothetical protein N7463_010925 [Penicillium fimorum]
MPSILILILLSGLPLVWTVPAQRRAAASLSVIIFKPKATVNPVRTASDWPSSVETTSAYSNTTRDYPGYLHCKVINNSGEDCLTFDVRRPSGIKADAKLSVLVWIFVSGFEQGAATGYDGSNIVTSSVELGMPVIFATMKYRLGGFGLLPGAEILKDGAPDLRLVD